MRRRVALSLAGHRLMTSFRLRPAQMRVQTVNTAAVFHFPKPVSQAQVEIRRLECGQNRPSAMPQIGYARAAELSKRSVKEGLLIRDLVTRDQVIPAEDIAGVLDLRTMTEIGVPRGTHSASTGG